MGSVAFCIRTELELSRPDPGDIIPWLCTLEFIIIPVTPKIVIPTICVSLVTQILDGWMDGWIAILHPFQQCFSHIRPMGG